MNRNPVMLGIVASSLLMLAACGGGGGGGGGGDGFRTGTYTGFPTYMMDGENAKTCLNYARTCYTLNPYKIRISESRVRNGEKKLLFARGEDQPFVANSEIGANEISFSESLNNPASCDPRSQIVCTGIRESVVQSVSTDERILEAEGHLILACTGNNKVVRCDVRERATLQG